MPYLSDGAKLLLVRLLKNLSIKLLSLLEFTLFGQGRPIKKYKWDQRVDKKKTGITLITACLAIALTAILYGHYLDITDIHVEDAHFHTSHSLIYT